MLLTLYFEIHIRVLITWPLFISDENSHEYIHKQTISKWKDPFFPFQLHFSEERTTRSFKTSSLTNIPKSIFVWMTK